ncbi:MFS transporter [Paenibacillus sp. PsM32]|uniref:MFS transporter n=1 Tax=Paenibacillus kyungheensis TaxID=1452732 RepID=A0AAX3M6N0_9BACL|nr:MULTISPECIES: MFS transporter [Paenibacillus]MDN4620017.1 MFS transporter [Paenibacillus sp. PsM32]WCT57889.1 MFS transporter [Paenibacillus kyungheensis]WDF49005.1 MFS transporter [Paenibacillus sp. KACC 21273]
MRDKVVIPLWAAGIFLVVMNTTMFNVSLPRILADLHISSSLGSWLISGYSIVFALSVVIFSRLSDWYPVRKLLMVGILLLVASCVIGFTANNFPMAMLARILQAAGAGPMQGLGLVLATRYVPNDRRGKSISLIAAGGSLAFGIGPVLGGFLTDSLGWNSLFLVTGLIVLLVPAYWKMLPSEKEFSFKKDQKFDIVGAGLLVIVIPSLLLSIGRLSWVNLLIAIVAFIVLVFHLRRSSNPFILPELFRNTAYRKMLFMSFCCFAINLGMVFLIPLVLNQVFGQSASFSGLMIFPGAILSAIMTPIIGRWIDQYGNYRLSFIGYIIMVVTFAGLIGFLTFSPYVLMAAYMLLASSFSAVGASLQNEVSRMLPRKQLSSGVGVFQLTQFFGGATATAVFGLLIARNPFESSSGIYRMNYVVLLTMTVLSLIMLIWYMRSKPVEPADHHIKI